MTKFLATFALLSSTAFAANSQWLSTYTNISTDCVVVSKSNQHAEIDFEESECKSFGGYRLSIAGGDLRYGPKLQYGPKEIDLGGPHPFHDPGSQNIEWVYSRTSQKDGAGKIQWRGLIFRLSLQDGETGKSRSELFAVRLDGSNSCLIGSTTDNVKARQLVYNSRPNCK